MSRRSFAQLQKTWNYYGETDPFWAVLTHPEKRAGQWDEREFFFTGECEIRVLLAQLAEAGLSPRLGRALDFGCGVGRLTQALGDHFADVTGVDIAASMIAQAREFNRHGERCHYVLNERADLQQLPTGSFDFIYSNIVLQHMRPKFFLAYLRELYRVLAPGGLFVFQLPTEERNRRDEPLFRQVLHWVYLHVYRKLRYGRPDTPDESYPMEMHGMAQDKLLAFLTELGADVREIRLDDAAGSSWVSYRYAVIKPDAGR